MILGGLPDFGIPVTYLGTSGRDGSYSTLTTGLPLAVFRYTSSPARCPAWNPLVLMRILVPVRT